VKTKVVTMGMEE